MENTIIIIGSDPVGCLLGTVLVRNGFKVSIYTQHIDDRELINKSPSNVLISNRGVSGLSLLKSDILQHSVVIKGRTVHSLRGETTDQPFRHNRKQHCISEHLLKRSLLTQAETEGVQTFFGHRLTEVDLNAGKLVFEVNEKKIEASANYIFSCDAGESSLLRSRINENDSNSSSINLRSVELYSPPGKEGSFRIDGQSYHIWMRSDHMLMAYPNQDGTFRFTLYLLDSSITENHLDNEDKVLGFFARHYPDVLPLIPDLTSQIAQSLPIHSHNIQFSSKWSLNDNILLVGDAAHTFPPMYNQDLNCSLEDIVCFNGLLEKHGKDIKTVIREFENLRKPQCEELDTILRRNLADMKEKTTDANFLARKQLEFKLSDHFSLYQPVFQLVTETSIPFNICSLIGNVQNEILDNLSKDATMPNHIDWKVAEVLIETKLEPLLKEHNITEKDYMPTAQEKPAPTQHRIVNIREFESGIVTDFRQTSSYGDYLGLSQLLSCQKPLSESPDELLFIIQHQTSELWLKLMLHEAQVSIQHLREDRVRTALKPLARIRQIQDTLTKQWSVLGTMTPPEYIVIRPVLGHASGFQSYQYRAVEFALGNKNPDMLKPHEHTPNIHRLLQELLNAPSLYDEYLMYLSRKGHDIPQSVLTRDFSQPYVQNESIVEVMKGIYTHPNKHWEEYEFAEKLVDLDENFGNWRYKHMTTVKRIIGYRIGTGGSSGVPFLEKALSFSFCPELWTVRSVL